MIQQQINFTPYETKSLINLDSLFSFDGVDQYVDCGINQNVINTIDYDRNFSISFFVQLNATQISTSYLVSQFSRFSGNNSRGWGCTATRISSTQYNINFSIAQQTQGPFTGLILQINRTLNINVIYHICISYNQISQTFNAYLNGNSTPATLSVFNGGLSSSVQVDQWRLVFARRDNVGDDGIGHTNCHQNHISIFNRILTETEVKYIHLYGGILPTSTHENCVAHYITKPGSDKFFDTVEQYNYTKDPKLISYNGQFINYTNQELGIDNFSGQNVLTNIYPPKEFLRKYVYNFIEQFGAVNTWLVFSGANASFQSSSFTYYTRFYAGNALENISNNYVLGNRNTGAIWHMALRITPNSPSSEIGTIGVVIGNAGITSVSSINYVGRWFRIVVTWDYDNDTAIIILGDDVNIITQVTVDTSSLISNKDLTWSSLRYGNANGSDNWHLITDEWIIANVSVSESDLEDIYNNQDFSSLSGNIFSHIIFNSIRGNIVEQIGGRTFTVDNDGWLDRNILSPPLRNAIYFNGDDQYGTISNFNPTNESGYSFVITCINIGSKTVQVDISKRNVNNENIGLSIRDNDGNGTVDVLFQSRGVGSGSTLQSTESIDVDRDSINQFVVLAHTDGTVEWYCNGVKYAEQSTGWQVIGFDDLTLDFTIGGSTLSETTYASNKNYCFIGLTKGILTSQQILTLWNNSLLNNPNNNWTNVEWQLLLGFNNIFDDSGTYKILDYSGNGNDVTLVNYTVNQTTIGNKEYQIIPIDVLIDNEIHEIITGFLMVSVSEQINLLDGITAPTETYIFLGSLPTGLNLSDSGALTGTPSELGTFNILIRLVDGSGNFEYKRVRITILDSGTSGTNG